MTLSADDFDTFFGEVNAGCPPFAWQRRLFDELAQTGKWPDRLVAPTGAGKSSVVEIHIFVVALAATGGIAAVPRRLSLVVNRRALVDSQALRASRIRDALDSAQPDSLLGAIAAALRSLRTERRADGEPAVFDVIDLRGGVAPRRDWVADPAACQIICATPDMWGSRVLFRGYGTSHLARPREAGLLVHDAAMVLDEAHLNRQLLLTARRVGQLAQPGSAAIGVSALQVVETTATPADRSCGDGNLREIGVEASDLAASHADPLARRLTMPKPVRLVGEAAWPPQRSGADRNRYLEVLEEETLRLHRTFGRTVGCFVNTVALAADVTARLRNAGLCVELLVGRMRPYDRAALESRRPNLLTVQGNPDVDVLVATQTLEVGVDVDLAALVTELAPASAMAQRAGRVNRLGKSDKTQVVVIGPAPGSPLLTEDPNNKDLSRLEVQPYAARGDIEVHEHLRHTWEWLGERAADPRGISPWASTDSPPPEQPPRRILLQRLEPYDVWYLSRTGADLFDEPDLELWLRDALEREDASCGVVVRAHLPSDDSAAAGLLRATPPLDGEIYPAWLGTIRKLLPVSGGDAGEHPKPERAFLLRDNEVEPLVDAGDLKPGDIVIVGSQHQVCTAGVVNTPPTEEGTDVYEEVAWQDGRVRLARFVTGMSDHTDRLLDELAELIASFDSEVDDQEIADLLYSYRDHDQRIPLLGEDLRSNAASLSISFGALEDPESRWLVVSTVQPAEVGDIMRQVWTPSPEPVPLDAHNAAVAERARELSARVGLPSELQEALSEAGRLHDVGKRDMRFQRFTLGNADADRLLLAKSPNRSIRQVARTQNTGGLPTRWRHEQLSAAIAAAELDATDTRNLVLRLVGTSHGHGRPGFPHTSEDLLGPDEDEQVTRNAAELFDIGLWDEVIEATQHRWGAWGCAYLEALLRAADGQVSGEGR